MNSNENTPLRESSHVAYHRPASLEDTGAIDHVTDTNDTKQLVLIEEDPSLRNNIPMASFNFINSIIGSGIIGMPFALHQAGFGMGIILLIVSGSITDYSVLLLIHGGHISGTNTYQELVQKAFGFTGFCLLSFLQFIFPFISMVGYNIIIGDTITKLLARIGGHALEWTVLTNRYFIIFLITSLIGLPLSLYKNIARLSKWAGLSILLVAVIVVFIIYKLVTFADDIPVTPDAYQFANTNVTQAIGIMASAYMCTHNTFLIHESLENPTPNRWHMVTHISILTAMMVMLLIGTLGYVTFTGYVQGDLLENYCSDDDFANLSRLLFTITIMLTYPVECFVARILWTGPPLANLYPARVGIYRSLNSLTINFPKIIQVIENSLLSRWQPCPLWRHIALTCLISLLAAAIAVTTDCLGIVLELNGVITAVPLTFIVPASCVIKLSPHPVFSVPNIGPILTIMFGVAVSSVGLLMASIEMVAGISCSHGMEMMYCSLDVATNISILEIMTTLSPY